MLLARGIMACCSKSSLRPIVGGLRGNNRALPPCPPRPRPPPTPNSLELGRKGQGNRCASSRRRSSGRRSRASCALGVPAPHPIMIVTSNSPAHRDVFEGCYGESAIWDGREWSCCVRSEDGGSGAPGPPERSPAIRRPGGHSGREARGVPISASGPFRAAARRTILD